MGMKRWQGCQNSLCDEQVASPELFCPCCKAAIWIGAKSGATLAFTIGVMIALVKWALS